MQAALAFTKVEGAFAFCISSYGKIAEWKAMLDRLSQFEDAMTAVDESRAQAQGIVVVSQHPERSLDISGSLDPAAGRLGDRGAAASVAAQRRPHADHRPVGLRQIDPVPGA